MKVLSMSPHLPTKPNTTAKKECSRTHHFTVNIFEIPCDDTVTVNCEKDVEVGEEHQQPTELRGTNEIKETREVVHMLVPIQS